MTLAIDSQYIDLGLRKLEYGSFNLQHQKCHQLDGKVLTSSSKKVLILSRIVHGGP